MESPENLSFEEAFAELEAIVQKLEDGTFNLDETVALYQRGRSLAEHCQRLLDSVELRVRQLTPGDEGGREVVAFDAEA